MAFGVCTAILSLHFNQSWLSRALITHARGDARLLRLLSHLRSGLDLVEVEGDVAGDGAVEPGLEEGGPSLLELVRAAAVVLADSGHSGINSLWTDE